jgi:4-amino-4-deoxy-L-arabinose transferase-like glycosyltransferase
MVAGAVVAMTYRVVAELMDDAVLGWLAAMLVLGVREFRYLSMVIMSHTVLMLLGLATVWAYLRWRRGKSLKWAAAVGAFAGWAAITRPLDALCYAAPVGVAMAWELFRSRDAKAIARTAVAVVLAAAPFLAMELTFDKGVTGHFLKTPYQFYMEQSAPNLAYGRTTYDPNHKPHTLVTQKL